MTPQERYEKYMTPAVPAGEGGPAGQEEALAAALAAELTQLGGQGVRVDEAGCLYGALAPSPGCEGVPGMGLIARLDPAGRRGAAVLFSALEELSGRPELPHGRIFVGGIAGAELDRGCSRFDPAQFGAAVAYALEPGPLGEIAYASQTVEPHMYLVLRAEAALRGEGIEPVERTDPQAGCAAALAQLGLPCPALAAGTQPEDLERLARALVQLLTVQKN